MATLIIYTLWRMVHLYGVVSNSVRFQHDRASLFLLHHAQSLKCVPLS
ncbi:hypothetical protein PANA5342_0790 [Pantoea ananatis LMG 5342]|nr:hypothetical protein PANA5342_0790 [Pantoea ananatis LMG 5342]